jgi:hypothetical protein
MFKGACRLDDPAHRTIILVPLCVVKENRLVSVLSFHSLI